MKSTIEIRRPALLALAVVMAAWCGPALHAADDGGADDEVRPLRVGVFEVDASPPVGSPLAYDLCKAVQTPLSCRGVVLIGQGEPVVICAVDWIGIANEAHDAWRDALAEAAGTTRQRVVVHTLHQHDAPINDFGASALLEPHGLAGRRFDDAFARDVIARASDAVRKAAQKVRAVSHIGYGQAKIENVASNRRILGPDGRVRITRYTATRDPAVRAEPVGTIDPYCKLVSFWAGDQPIAALSWYATHPQSYYRTGLANPDFPGYARNARQEATAVPHVHFNGAGGDIGAGKWNDGSKENRPVLANRVAVGMSSAWRAAADNRERIAAADLRWSVEPVALPPAEHLNAEALAAVVADEGADAEARVTAARELAWLRRCRRGHEIDIACLTLGDRVRVLHMPGELLIAYQLAAQQMRPELFVAMAAYGDYAPGYICPAIAYEQGGYEASPGASRVAPGVENVLIGAMQRLLQP